jgi:hypothetical protein
MRGNPARAEDIRARDVSLAQVFFQRSVARMRRAAPYAVKQKSACKMLCAMLIVDYHIKQRNKSTMTRLELLSIAKKRHRGDNWITAFAGELGVSYWTIYRIENNKAAKVSELVRLKVNELLRNDQTDTIRG